MASVPLYYSPSGLKITISVSKATVAAVKCEPRRGVLTSSAKMRWNSNIPPSDLRVSLEEEE